MGVIKGNGDLFGFKVIDDSEHILEPAISSASEDEEVTRRVPKRVPRTKPMTRDLSMSEAIANRRKGAKQARRCDNLRELISMVEKEEIELDFSIFEPTVSAFAELLSEKEKMQTWNDFVNSSEEEQRDILQRGKQRASSSCNEDNNSMAISEDSDNNNVDSTELDDSWVEVKDKRSAHPSFSAEACFQKLDKNIRAMLKRRQRPMGMLVSLEHEIIQFFKEWPSSVYISKLSSSYERMMLHALCQYLDLISKSYDLSGIRQTQVENPNSTFSLPPILLTQYLEKAKMS